MPSLLIRDACVVAGILFFFIDLLRLVLCDDFAVHGLFTDLDLAIGQRSGLRDGEGINGFHGRVVDVLELLADLRLRETVVDGHDNVMADDFRGFQTGIDGRECARRLQDGRDDGEHGDDRSFDVHDKTPFL